MQRTQFMDGILMKKQHKHPIPLTVFPDRFMFQNRSEVEALRKKVEMLRKKITYLKECLGRYTDFNGSGIPLEGALSQTMHFFAAQGQEQPPETNLTPEEMTDVQVHLPLRQNACETSIAQQLLNQFRNQAKDQIKSLE